MPMWMASWQGWQTTRVFRLFLIMSAAHAGWPALGFIEVGEFPDLVHCHLARFPAQLAPSS